MNFKIFLTILSLIFFSTSNVYAEVDSLSISAAASEFVISLMKDADNLSKLPKDQQEEALLRLVNRGFNIPLVARFVMGRYWRRATVSQRSEFLDVFEHAAVRTFSPLIGNISLENFKIDRVIFDYNENKHRVESLVFSTLTSDKRVIKIRWRLRGYLCLSLDCPEYQIIDIVAEGISLVVTLRSEYTTYIKNHSIDELIIKLQEQGK